MSHSYLSDEEEGTDDRISVINVTGDISGEVNENSSMDQRPYYSIDAVIEKTSGYSKCVTRFCVIRTT